MFGKTLKHSETLQTVECWKRKCQRNVSFQLVWQQYCFQRSSSSPSPDTRVSSTSRLRFSVAKLVFFKTDFQRSFVGLCQAIAEYELWSQVTTHGSVPRLPAYQYLTFLHSAMFVFLIFKWRWKLVAAIGGPRSFWNIIMNQELITYDAYKEITWKMRSPLGPKHRESRRGVTAYVSCSCHFRSKLIK